MKRKLVFPISILITIYDDGISNLSQKALARKLALAKKLVGKTIDCAHSNPCVDVRTSRTSLKVDLTCGKK